MPLVGSASELLNWINPNPTCSNANNGFKGALRGPGEFPTPPGHFVQNPRIPHHWLPPCLARVWRGSVECAYQLRCRIYALTSPCEASLTSTIILSITAGSSLNNFPHIKNQLPPTYPLQLVPSDHPCLSTNVSFIVCPGFRLLVAVIVCNSADHLLMALKTDSFSSFHCKLLIQQYWLNPGPFSEYTLKLHHSHPHMCSYHLKCSFCWSLFHSSTLTAPVFLSWFNSVLLFSGKLPLATHFQKATLDMFVSWEMRATWGWKNDLSFFASPIPAMRPSPGNLYWMDEWMNQYNDHTKLKPRGKHFEYYC